MRERVAGRWRALRGYWRAWWLWRVLWALHRVRLEDGESSLVCANRNRRTFRVWNYEVALVFRNTDRPDGYSREELVGMLEEVRRHERRQGWRVSEPGPEVGNG